MKMLALALAVFTGLKAQAAITTFGANFNAPTINDKSNVTNPVAGEIVYDQSDSTFWGFTHGSPGSWIPFATTTNANAVVADVSGERLIRVSVTSMCTASPCTIASSTGVSSVTRSGAGAYTVNFNPSFSSAPACTVSIISSGQAYGVENINSSTSSVSFSTYGGSPTPGALNTAFHVICMGPQ